MNILKVERSAKTNGDAQNALRSIIKDLNLGRKKGDGWVFGEGEIEHLSQPRARLMNPQLSDLTAQLQLLIDGKDLREMGAEDVEQLAKIVPMVAEALQAEGYGIQGAINPTGAAGGSGDEETVEDTGKAPENASQEATGDAPKVETAPKKRFPWDPRS